MRKIRHVPGRDLEAVKVCNRYPLILARKLSFLAAVKALDSIQGPKFMLDVSLTPKSSRWSEIGTETFITMLQSIKAWIFRRPVKISSPEKQLTANHLRIK